MGVLGARGQVVATQLKLKLNVRESNERVKEKEENERPVVEERAAVGCKAGNRSYCSFSRWEFAFLEVLR